jgi:hypothetical protein
VRVRCACPPDTEGTPRCNHGRLCGTDAALKQRSNAWTVGVAGGQRSGRISPTSRPRAVSTPVVRAPPHPFRLGLQIPFIRVQVSNQPGLDLRFPTVRAVHRRAAAPAVNDLRASALAGSKHGRKDVRRHLTRKQSRATRIGLKQLKPSEPFCRRRVQHFDGHRERDQRVDVDAAVIALEQLDLAAERGGVRRGLVGSETGTRAASVGRAPLRGRPAPLRLQSPSREGTASIGDLDQPCVRRRLRFAPTWALFVLARIPMDMELA